MTDCLFCKIINKEIPAEFIYEDDYAVAIKDITPQAPYHYLVIPRDHYEGVHEVPLQKAHYFDNLINAVTAVVEKEDLDKKGYRLVINYGEKAGQSVPHIHIHVLSGRSLHWPPG